MKPLEAFPLSWPQGTPRTRSPRRSAFKQSSLAQSRDELLSELKMLKASDVIISTDLKLRLDGLPISGQAQPRDKGVAIFFRWQNAPRSMACDKWDRIEDNVHALALSVSAMRGLERWGATDILQKAFQGFTALPAPGRPWYVVLGLPRNSSAATIRDKWRTLAASRHPDTGGSHELMTELNQALEEAVNEIDRN